LAAPSLLTRRGLHRVPVLRHGLGGGWGQGPEVEGASERAPPPLRFFGKSEMGESVLRASLQESPRFLGINLRELRPNGVLRSTSINQQFD
jgi:hypothetical protein